MKKLLFCPLRLAPKTGRSALVLGLVAFSLAVAPGYSADIPPSDSPVVPPMVVAQDRAFLEQVEASGGHATLTTPRSEVPQADLPPPSVSARSVPSFQEDAAANARVASRVRDVSAERAPASAVVKAKDPSVRRTPAEPKSAPNDKPRALIVRRGETPPIAQREDLVDRADVDIDSTNLPRRHPSRSIVPGTIMLTDEDRDLVTSQLSTSGARTYHKTAPDPEDRTYVFERRTIMPPEVAAIEEARDEAYRSAASSWLFPPSFSPRLASGAARVNSTMRGRTKRRSGLVS